MSEVGAGVLDCVQAAKTITSACARQRIFLAPFTSPASLANSEPGQLSGQGCLRMMEPAAGIASIMGRA